MRVAYARPGHIQTHVSLPYRDRVIKPLLFAYAPRRAQEQRFPITELSLEGARQREQYFEEGHMLKLRVILSDDEPEGSQL